MPHDVAEALIIAGYIAARQPPPKIGDYRISASYTTLYLMNGHVVSFAAPPLLTHESDK